MGALLRGEPAIQVSCTARNACFIYLPEPFIVVIIFENVIQIHHRVPFRALRIGLGGASPGGHEWGEVGRPEGARVAAVGMAAGVAWVLDAHARLFFRYEGLG